MYHLSLKQGQKHHIRGHTGKMGRGSPSTEAGLPQTQHSTLGDHAGPKAPSGCQGHTGVRPPAVAVGRPRQPLCSPQLEEAGPGPSPALLPLLPLGHPRKQDGFYFISSEYLFGKHRGGVVFVK